MMTNRYHRQSILPEIGAEGQDRLRAARVLVIGAGGLGCPALQYLAGAGVGTIGIVDHDRVDVTNLHRQTLYNTHDAGGPKATTAAKTIQALNPECHVVAHNNRLDANNGPDLIQSYDVVLDGTDNFATKFLINDLCVKHDKPLVYGAVQGYEGQVAVFDATRGPCYRCLHPDLPQAPIMNCAEAGVLGPVAGLTGTAQALEAVKIVLGHQDLSPRYGVLFLLDGRRLASQSFQIPKNPNCPTCSKPKETIMIDHNPDDPGPIPEIDIEDELLHSAKIIDVREVDEWEAGYIDGAHHLPLSVLLQNPGTFEDIASDGHHVFYCQKGMRSLKAAEILKSAGYERLYSLAGGYSAWEKRKK